MTMTEEISGKRTIGEAMGRITSGVYIVTAEGEGEKAGMLASWIQQAGFEPPTLTVAIHPDRELHKLIRRTGRFTINVISKDNTELMRAFSKYQPDQFEKVSYRSTYCGLILNDAVASMDCVVKNTVSGGDHDVFVAEVVGGGLLNNDLQPMSHLRKSGFTY